MNKEAYKEANQALYIRERKYTGQCTVCQTKLWKRDVDYARRQWNTVVCSKHVPDEGMLKQTCPT